MSKTIFRVDKNPDNPFVMIDRRPIENPNLSWKAKGILAYLLSRPDNWIVRIGDLVKRSPDGVLAVRNALKELTKAGHITRSEERDNGRFKQYVLTVHELPLIGFPQAVNPQADNLTLNNTDDSNNDIKNQIVQKANKKVDAILAMQKEYKYAGRELIRDNLLVYADWYNQATGQEMTKRAQKSWWKALQTWQDEGLGLNHLQEAFWKQREWRVVSDPNQLTADAIAIKAANAVTRKEDKPKSFPKLVNGRLVE